MKSSIVLFTSIVAAFAVVLGVFIFFNPEEEVELPVSVEYYYDLTCGACASFHSTSSQIRDEFSEEEMEFSYVPNPILGPVALQSAYAAEAAREQGKYREYIDIAFENFDARSDEDLISFAEELELDIEKFNEDRESEVLQDRVNTQLETNREKGITSTPTVYVNGRVTNSRSFEDLRNLIQEKIDLGKQQAEESEEAGEAGEESPESPESL